MDTAAYDKLAREYKWVTWFGIFLNSLFIFPLLIAPVWFLGLLELSVPSPIIWAQLPGMLLLWISIFYIPATIDLKKYRVFAWLAIFPSRVGGATACIGAVLFLDQEPGFLSIGFVDLFILLLQLRILLKIRAVEHPLPPELAAKKARHRRRWIWATAAVVVVLGALGWYKLLREVDQRFELTDEQKKTLSAEQQQDALMAMRFKYGSIGTENQDGLPYWIWLVLPRIFPEYLPGPGGYNALGLYSEQGRGVPIGFSVKTIGFERVGINCALCHTGSVRFTATETPTLLVAGATTTFDALGYQRFLFRSAADPRFNADTIMAEIAKMYKLSVLDKALYRYVLVPVTRRALNKQREMYSWTEARPYWGRGRIDPFNPVKKRILNVDVGDTIGNSDMVPIWNLGLRKGMAFHWDGLNTDIDEVIRSSAIGDGAKRNSVPPELDQLKNWLIAKAPPKLPPRVTVDAALVSSGKTVFDRECAACHAGPQTGQVIPAEKVGTDDHRVKIWTPQAAAAYNGYGPFKHFRSTNGYVAVPLDAIWAREPYLHNGSVPTLRDMLEPPQQRPKVFYRGYDLFDAENVGFVSQGGEAQRVGFRYDTEVTGNSNAGHLFGTALPPDEKRALLEYLKTL